MWRSVASCAVLAASSTDASNSTSAIARPSESRRAIGRTSTRASTTRQPVHFELKINHAEMAAPETRHDSRLAVNGPALCINARQTDKILAGKQQVLMAQEQRVNAVEPGEVLARVLLASS